MRRFYKSRKEIDPLVDRAVQTNSAQERQFSSDGYVVLPANWPLGAEAIFDFSINTRPHENTVYNVAIESVGVEQCV